MHGIVYTSCFVDKESRWGPIQPLRLLRPYCFSWWSQSSWCGGRARKRNPTKKISKQSGRPMACPDSALARGMRHTSIPDFCRNRSSRSNSKLSFAFGESLPRPAASLSLAGSIYCLHPALHSPPLRALPATSGSTAGPSTTRTRTHARSWECGIESK